MAETAVIERYVAGEPVKELAAEFGVKPTSVQSMISRNGLGHARLARRRERCAIDADAYHARLSEAKINTTARTRSRPIAWARHALMTALRRDGHALLSIAAALKMDHTTVIHGITETATCDLRKPLADALRSGSSLDVEAAVTRLIASCSRTGTAGKAKRK